MPDMEESWALVGLSRAAHILHDQRAAEWIHERLLPVADRNASVGGNIFVGCVSHALALTASVRGRHDESAGWFEAALRRYEANRWWAFWAEAAVQYADTGEGVLEPERRRELLDRALELSIDLGLGLIEPEARRVIARLEGDDVPVPPLRTQATRRDKIRGKITARGRHLVAN